MTHLISHYPIDVIEHSVLKNRGLLTQIYIFVTS